MSKTRTEFVCQNCGATFAKWFGRCPECGEWDSLTEQVVAKKSAGRGPRVRTTMPLVETTPPRPITEIDTEDFQRLPVQMGELRRVLGGGIVPGMGVLVGGEPGIGKSTLLLQLAAEIARDHGPVLYVTGEESAQQVKLRARRLGIEHPNLYILAEIHLETILHHIEQMQPTLVVVDSIQAVYSEALPAAAGNVSQVKECAARLLRLTKMHHIPLFLVGHVTKEGVIAGPRVLEHMVDTVLYFEGERFHAYRILRAVKNRFGSTNEVGVFEMGERGLLEVPNPSEAFLAERLPNASGSAIAVTMEGTRPLLVEVQALTSTTAFSQPRRTVNGVDFNRLLLLTAVLSKRVGLRLSDQDVFVNVVGGLRVDEPAADLAVAVAIASSMRNQPVPADTVLVGEVGLSGEVRSVSYLLQRLREAAKLGFKRAVVPRAHLRKNDPLPDGMEVLRARTLSEALAHLELT